MTRELHVSRAARERFGVGDELFTLAGGAVLANLRSVRALVAGLDAGRPPERRVGVARLNALGLIDEILHAIVGLYRRQGDPGAVAAALDDLDQRLGRDTVDATLRRFVADFPPVVVHRGGLAVDAYLAGTSGGVPNREVALEELLNLWLTNQNTAAAPMADLFADDELAVETAYPAISTGLQRFFAGRPPFGPAGQDLVTLLRSPAAAEPQSLGGQLRWIRTHWADLLADAFGPDFGDLFDRLLTGLDIAAEEERALGLRGAGPGGGGTSVVPTFGGAEAEPEAFSADLDWMPKVVLMAKSTHVWLDQLSRWYGREIRVLDAIPDEELATLSRRGFTALWLIGIWERSLASERIKRMRGNPDAVASAYSLRDYAIAADLGGEPAFERLRERARAHGIRLASDMVPNHMGIDSRWVIEHPGWFLGLDEPPYPAYSFTGPDLSDDPRVGIVLEDHYWDASDAAVVFKRIDRATGAVRYLYHGNDGTSMPWNDTAQLDYLQAEVREAVIRAILSVARRFPIIRFDAAMTLARRHVQRLWFPEPGSGGGIPSRAEHGLGRDAFDAAMPVEFWREVVDRVAAEVPDTLLLAEAFWLLEGYFVRTLGMHRVYNSAFMNMLRDERNAEYRLVVRNTLEFDPEVLKRYVNFMNNPDERTAIEQFGSGDKYIGVCTLMATIPGLPMFGHGQVEGFAEKYGMEYRRAYWDERPDESLVGRHEREIFPLLHRRWLFAEVRDFLFYDVDDDAGHVNEDVFAYSNRAGGERALVVYHNRFASMAGRVRDSVAFAVKGGDGEKTLVRATLAHGLGLPDDPGAVAIARDFLDGREYLWTVGELRATGLAVRLDAYGRRILLDWRIVPSADAADHRALAADLAGAGVSSVEVALADRRLRPIHEAAARLVRGDAFRPVLEVVDALRAGTVAPAAAVPVIDTLAARSVDALRAARAAAGAPLDDAALYAAGAGFRARLATAIRLATAGVTSAGPGGTGAGEPRPAGPSMPGPIPEAPAGGDAAPGTGPSALGEEPPDETAAAFAFVASVLQPRPATWATLLGWLAGLALAGVLGPDAARGHGWFDRLSLGRTFADAARGLGLDEAAAWWSVETIRHLLARPGEAALAAPPAERPGRLVRAWFADEELARWLGVNRYEGVAYLNRESFEEALGWVAVLVAVAGDADPAVPDAPAARDLVDAWRLARRLESDAAEAGYQVGKLVELAGHTAS